MANPSMTVQPINLIAMDNISGTVRMYLHNQVNKASVVIVV